MRIHIHICLVSDQLLANYLPIKLEGPAKVFIIGTAYTEKKGLSQRFEKLLASLDNISVHRATKLAPDDDFSRLHEYFLEISEEISALNADNITLNLTGGTKLMSLAAYEMLKEDCQRIIYTNTQAGKIDELRTKTSTPLPNLLKVEEYLISYGVSPKSYNNQSEDWINAVESRRQLTKQLAEFFSKDKHFLSMLNYTAQQAITKKPNSTHVELTHPKQTFKQPLNDRQYNLLEQCQAFELIDVEDNDTIYFRSAKAAQYLGGFWLEEYAYLIATDVGVDEIRCGQAIQWDKTTRNELDMVIIHNNRLLIMECKTAKFGEEQKDDQIIYKLDSIAEDLRGLYGKKWLLSIHDIQERTEKRAKSQGIEIIASKDVKNLKQKMQAWKNE